MNRISDERSIRRHLRLQGTIESMLTTKHMKGQAVECDWENVGAKSVGAMTAVIP